MEIFKYFSLFFIATSVFGDNSIDDDTVKQRRVIDWKVKTQFHISSSGCPKSDYCKVGSANEKKSSFKPERCCHDFEKNKRLTVIVHGVSVNYKQLWISEIAKALTKQPNQTVIAVNWQIHHPLEIVQKNTLLYRPSWDRVRNVANITAKFLAEKIIKSEMKQVEHLHIIGHSMGSHVAALIAERLNQTYGITVNRLSGLDPALPCFRKPEDPWVLKKSHAQFVDIIHSNSDPDDDATYGTYRPMGHVDIYPNGGDNQPGCSKRDGPLLPTLPGQPFYSFSAATYTCDIVPLVARNVVRNPHYLSCNHYGAPNYMALSIKYPECKYWAAPSEDAAELAKTTPEEFCKNGKCVQMGINTRLNENNLEGTKYYIDMEILEEKCKHF